MKPGEDGRHVIALLGKALRDGEISREFAGRLATFAGALRDRSHEPQPYVAICGGNGESQQAFQYLRENHPELLPPSDRCLDDSASRSTRQNFEALGRFLTSIAATASRQIELTVVTTDYHVERIRFVERHLPKQSLLQFLRHAIQPEHLLWKAAAYQPVAHRDPTVKWFGMTYVLADRLVPLQVNLEGMIQANLECFVPPVYELFARTIDELVDHIGDAGSQLSAEFESRVAAISPQIEILRQACSHLQPLVNVENVSRERLRELHRSIQPAVIAVKRAADPDAEAFDRYFEGKE